MVLLADKVRDVSFWLYVGHLYRPMVRQSETEKAMSEQQVSADNLVDLVKSSRNEGVRVTVQTRDGTWAMEGLMTGLDLRLMEGVKAGIEIRPEPDEEPRDQDRWLLDFGLVVTREERTNVVAVTPHGEQDHFKVYRWWSDREAGR